MWLLFHGINVSLLLYSPKQHHGVAGSPGGPVKLQVQRTRNCELLLWRMSGCGDISCRAERIVRAITHPVCLVAAPLLQQALRGATLEETIAAQLPILSLPQPPSQATGEFAQQQSSSFGHASLQA